MTELRRRRHQIKTAPVYRWVALDDDRLHYPASVNLVLVDPAKGFDEEAARLLREALA